MREWKNIQKSWKYTHIHTSIYTFDKKHWTFCLSFVFRMALFLSSHYANSLVIFLGSHLLIFVVENTEHSLLFLQNKKKKTWMSRQKQIRFHFLFHIYEGGDVLTFIYFFFLLLLIHFNLLFSFFFYTFFCLSSVLISCDNIWL